jgi:hypothetical protein
MTTTVYDQKTRDTAQEVINGYQGIAGQARNDKVMKGVSPRT